MMFDSLSLTFVGQLVAAFVGTAAFAVLFGVPGKHYISCGFVGMLGWMLYIVLTRYAGATPSEATFASTLLVTFVSRFMSVLRKCPVTVFLICGIFPLVPGGGIFWTTYYIVSDQLQMALQSGFGSIKVVAAIVFGILVITELPNRLFLRMGQRCLSGRS